MIKDGFGDHQIKMQWSQEMLDDLKKIKPFDTEVEFEGLEELLLKEKNILRKKKLDSL